MESQEKHTRSSKAMNSFDEASDDSGFRRKDDRKKHKEKSSNSSKYKQTTSSASNSSTGANSLSAGSRYHHHREVPPRFQQNKQTKGQKNTAKPSVNKKPMKETSRLQQQSTSSHQHHHSNHGSKRSDDGGWSKGKPEKGSGWNKKNIQYSASTPDSMDRFSSHGWDTASGDEVKDSVSRSNWLSADTKVSSMDSDTWALSATSPSDNDEESRSQSPGGLVMLGGEREGKEKLYLPVNDDNTTGVSHWGTNLPSNELGSIWKGDSAVDESEEEVAKIMTGAFSNTHFSGGRKNSAHNRLCDWSINSEGFTDVDKSSKKSNPNSLNRSEHEPCSSTISSDACNGHHEATDSKDELRNKSVDMYSLETRSGNETPNRCSSRSSGGGITPTGKQESGGGRASVGSTSSANSVSSNSSWNSDGKGGNKSNANRSNSPRKISRYERCGSQSDYSGSGNGGGIGNPAVATYKNRKPKTSIAELEDGLESLQQEPSGWGDLPSPKPSTEIDNGTELWGVPPDDRTRSLGDTEEARKNRLWKSNPNADNIGWGEDPSGTRTAGWGPKETTKPVQIGTPMQIADKTSDSSTSDLISYSTTEDSEEMSSSTSFTLLSGGKTKHSGQAGSVGGGASNTPFGGSLPGPSQAHVKMQQQRLPSNQHGGSSGAMAMTPSSSHTYQQQLLHQLGQLQMNKEMIKQQMAKASASNAQPLSEKLVQIEQAISYFNQQLMLSRVSGEQKDTFKNQDSLSKPSAGGSLKSTRSTQPVHRRMDLKPNGNIERSLPSSSMSLGGLEKTVTSGVQNLSLGGMPPSSVSQTSARSISRLQQIISGSSSSEDLDTLTANEDILSASVFTPGTPSGVFPGQQSHPLVSPFSPPHSGSVFSHSEANEKFSSNSGTNFSPSTIPTPKSFDDIQEFTPGVPWQPKAQPNDLPQLYFKQNSVPSSSGGYDSPMVPPTTMQSSSRHHQITRSQSVGGGMYYSGGSGMSRSSGRSNYKYGGSSHQSWNARPGYGSSQEQRYFAKSGQRTVSYGGPPTPTSSFNQPYPMKASQSGWKQPKQNRRNVSPSNLPPSVDYQYRSNFNRNAGTPQSTHLTPSTPGGQAEHGTQSWAAYTSVATSPMISNTVWGPSSTSKSQESSKDHHWDNGSNQVWSKKSHVEPLGFSSFAGATPSSLAYTPSPSKPMASQVEQQMTPNSVESLTPGTGPWGRDSFDSAPSGRMLSPEPTFAEWQAGKKARLSVFKLPSSPPSSSWLIIKSVSPQITEAVLRDTCAQYGEILTFVVSYPLECAVVRYRTMDEAIMAKTAFDKVPNICRVSITVHFLSEADAEALCESLTDNQQPGLSGPSWFSSDRSYAQTTIDQSLRDEEQPSRENDQDRFLKWGNASAHSNPSLPRQSSLTTTQGNSSLWNDGGFLSGLSSPWHGDFSAPNPSSNAERMVPGASSIPSVSGSSATMSTLLPNGLL